MPDTPDCLFTAEKDRDVKNTGAEFGADQHDPQRGQQLAGFDGFGGRHFLELDFEGGRFPGRRRFQLMDPLVKKKVLSR